MLRSILFAALLALNAPPPAPVDYQTCALANPGPIERPDHYNANPHGRKADIA